MTHPPHTQIPRHLSGDAVLPAVGDDGLAAVLSVLVAPVAVLDADSLDVLAVSRGLGARTGRAVDDLVGHSVFGHLVPREDQFALQAAIRSAREGGASSLRLSLLGPDSTLPTRWTCHLVAGTRGDADRVVLASEAGRTPRPPVVEADEATVLTDLTGTVTAASAGIASLLGHGADDLVGRPFPLSLFDREQLSRRAEAAGQEVGLSLLLLDPTRFDRRQNRQVDLGELDRRGGREDQARPGERAVDWTLTRRDGTTVVAAVRVTPLRDDAGGVVGYRATASDVTEERRTHQLLVSAVIREREAVRRLAELDQIQRDFIGRASHELRTPLTSMLGYTELLFEAAAELTNDDRAMVEAIARNAGRLNMLVEDLLVLSRAQALTDDHPTERVDVTAVIAGARDLVAQLVEERDLTVRIDLPDHAVAVEGDAAQLERIVVNLVSNAVKYTRDGGEVGCSLSTEGGSAVVLVCDTGIGMSQADIEQVFTPFFRTGAVEADRIRGTGLGLAIVKQLIERHRGEVTVVSVEGVGSTFTVTLPLPGERGT